MRKKKLWKDLAYKFRANIGLFCDNFSLLFWVVLCWSISRAFVRKENECTRNTEHICLYLFSSFFPPELFMIGSELEPRKKNSEQLRKIADTRGKLHRGKKVRNRIIKKNNNRVALFFNSFSNDFCMWLTSFRENYVEKMIFLVVFYCRIMLFDAFIFALTPSHTLGFVSSNFSKIIAAVMFVCRYSSDRFDSM